MDKFVIACTGHRPERITQDEDRLREVIAGALREGQADTVICGMASGFDLISGTTALRVGLKVIAAKPWAGHSPRVADKALYAEVIESAIKVVAVDESEEYRGPWVYQKRNEWMVDYADRVLAYWDGSEGGTFNCIDYAKQVRKPMRNIYGLNP